jgi:hypothetical protein
MLFVKRLLESLHDSFRAVGFQEKELRTAELLGLFNQ